MSVLYTKRDCSISTYCISASHQGLGSNWRRLCTKMDEKQARINQCQKLLTFSSCSPLPKNCRACVVSTIVLSCMGCLIVLAHVDIRIKYRKHILRVLMGSIRGVGHLASGAVAMSSCFVAFVVWACWWDRVESFVHVKSVAAPQLLHRIWRETQAYREEREREREQESKNTASNAIPLVCWEKIGPCTTTDSVDILEMFPAISRELSCYAGNDHHNDKCWFYGWCTENHALPPPPPPLLLSLFHYHNDHH